MNTTERENAIQKNKSLIWERVRALKPQPIYPAIVRRVLITAKEEEYFDRDLDYDEKYGEELQLRAGFIVAHFESKGELLGIGDCTILDIGKGTLLRAPRVTRCGLVLPILSYQGHTSQPQDYLTYFEAMNTFMDNFQASEIKQSLRC